MHLQLLATGTLAAFAAIMPATALAQAAPAPAPAPSGMPAMPAMPANMNPFGAPQALDAHVWVTDGTTKRELAQTQAQVAQSNIQGMPGAGSMASAMAKNLATSALAVAAGPIGAVASSVFSMFNHHSAPRPKFQATLALAGQQSTTQIRSSSTTFECNYAAIPGIDPDAYVPQILKLGVTKDNWRVVSVLTSNDPSSMTRLMMPAALSNMPNAAPPGSHDAIKLDETPVQGAAVQTTARGVARITLSEPLAPGEYAIVLRPSGNTQDDSLQRVLRAMWDFEIPAAAPHR
ncbi:MAG TPA: hypothetical protein VGZ02_16310 [Candidatus Baltobacteraceae bacterium]|jgi:hypothetical protein|nr:hypothetical protein [Candidatus Baltobacteraceae bacterium]